MGYLVKKQQRRARGRQGMGDWGSTVGGFADVVLLATAGEGGKQAIDYLRDKMGNEVVMKCLAESNELETVKAIDSQILQLAKTWQPSGYYSPEQVVQIIAIVQQASIPALNAITAAPASYAYDGGSAIKEFVGKLNLHTAEADVYRAAAAEAIRTGVPVIDSPGLKRWVINTLNDISATMSATYVLTCSKTFLDRFWEAVKAIGEFLLSLAKVVLKAGELVLKIPDAISGAWTVVKWGAILGGAWWFYTEFMKPRIGR